MWFWSANCVLSASCSSTALHLPLYLYLYPYCTYLFFIHLYTCEILLEYPLPLPVSTYTYYTLVYTHVFGSIHSKCVEVKTNRRRGTTGETTSFQALGLHGSHRWKMKSQTTLYCGWDFWLTSVAVISGVSTQSVLRRLATLSTDNVSKSVLYYNNYIWTKTLVYQAAGWLESFATIVFSSFKHCVRCSAHRGHQFMFASVMLGLDGTFVSYLSLQMCHNS